MPKFRMLRRVVIDRQHDYQQGEIVDLDREVGQRLVEGGHAEPADDKTTDSGSDTASRKSRSAKTTAAKTDSDNNSSSSEG